MVVRLVSASFLSLWNLTAALSETASFWGEPTFYRWPKNRQKKRKNKQKSMKIKFSFIFKNDEKSNKKCFECDIGRSSIKCFLIFLRIVFISLFDFIWYRHNWINILKFGLSKRRILVNQYVIDWFGSFETVAWDNIGSGFDWSSFRGQFREVLADFFNF